MTSSNLNIEKFIRRVDFYLKLNNSDQIDPASALIFALLSDSYFSDDYEENLAKKTMVLLQKSDKNTIYAQRPTKGIATPGLLLNDYDVVPPRSKKKSYFQQRNLHLEEIDKSKLFRTY
jgi:hypothetical protein